MSVAGRTILVTGGSRGIGRAIVRELASAGARVAFTYRERAEESEKLVAELSDGGGDRVAAFRCDSADFDAVRATVREVAQRLGPIDGLVNNAGITRDRLFVMMRPEDWRDVIETDLTGAFHFCRSVVYAMVKRHAGKIVNVGSVSGLLGNPGQVNYSAAKAGLIGLTKALARELARQGVTVNLVAPGCIDTDMMRALPARSREAMLASIPLGRLGEPREVARLVAYLLGSDGDYLTGQVLSIDGGLAI